MDTTADSFKLTCFGRLELPEEDPIFGTYWMPCSLDVGTAADIKHAIALAECYAHDPESRYIGASRRRLDPLRILVHDASNRLVLGGRVAPEGLMWSTPVASEDEATSVRNEVGELHSLSSSEAGWDNHSTAQGLWDRADVLETRLVDPCWRSDALAALHQHNHKTANDSTD